MAVCSRRCWLICCAVLFGKRVLRWLLLEAALGRVLVGLCCLISTQASWIDPFLRHFLVPFMNWFEGREQLEHRAFLDFFPIMYYAELDAHLFVGQRPSDLSMRFDWQLWSTDPPGACTPGRCLGADPRTVLAVPHAVRPLLRLASEAWDASRADRVVVFAGTETPLSEAFGASAEQRAATVERLRKYFRAIFFFVKDAEVEGVQTMPTLLSHWNTFERAESAAASAAICAARLDRKDRAVLAAWGMRGGADDAHGALELDEEAWRRRMRAGDGERRISLWNSLPGYNLSRQAARDRRDARAWAGTDEAAAAGVEVRNITKTDWWSELAKYRFCVCPLGSAIQSNKITEALLVLTVPIVRRSPQPVHGDLLRMGFPMVAVDAWEEVTSARLEQWWRELGPRLASFRRSCLTSEGLWRLLTGLGGACA